VALNGALNVLDRYHQLRARLERQSVDYAKGDPLANLALVRSVYFPTPRVALGGGSKPLLSQAQWFDAADPTDASYVENVMWLDSSVLFVTLNVPGGSNNDADLWHGTPTATQA